MDFSITIRAVPGNEMKKAAAPGTGKPRLLIQTSLELRRWSRCEKSEDPVVTGTHRVMIPAHAMGLEPPTEKQRRGLFSSRSHFLSIDSSCEDQVAVEKCDAGSDSRQSI